jgi:hypothetical protein
VSVSSGEFGLDPWAWLHEIDNQDAPDISGFHVVAAVIPADGDEHRCRRAVESQTHPVAQIVTALTPETEGDWIWVVPDDTEPEPDALSVLLHRVLKQREAAVFGCLLIEPRRRGAGKMVSDWAQTISTNGRMRTLTDPGELYQGQLTPVPALGVPAAGMLVRGDTWRFLGGFNTDLPRSHWGLDFGWRANLTGYAVVADPDAQLTNYSGFGDPADDRAAGLALVLANTPRIWRWLVTLRLLVVTVGVGVGYLLGKDLTRSGEEFRGLWRWLRSRDLRHSLDEQLASLPIKPSSAVHTRSLQPARGSGIRRSAALTTARFGGWIETFSGKGAGVSLDEMTGDDFADVGTHHSKVPLAATASAALVAGALLAARNTYQEGYLTGAQLLAAPASWSDLVAGYLTPVPGAAGSGTPWAALLGLFSLVTLGHPDWLVTLIVVLAVPLAWLLAFRLLRQLVSDRYLAGAGALAYALTPALLGGLNSGILGTAVTTVLLPVLGYSARHWLGSRRWSWRAAVSVAFWLLLICAVVPLFWAPALVAVLIIGIRAGLSKAWMQLGVVLGAPLLLLIGPWGEILVRYPGRLLTGIEPTLAPTDAVPGWLLAFGHPLQTGAPLWLSIVFFAASWLAAVIGAWRRPSFSVPALGVATGAIVIAIGISRLTVLVPPGDWVRPQALEWLVVLVGALVMAAVAGLDGITSELSGKALGLRHLASLGLVVVAVVALVASTGWWVLAGQIGLSRGPVGMVPTFVSNAQVSATPGRTLALAAEDGLVRWSLVEGDFSRLGDAERGLAYGGDPAAQQLAASVVARLVGDSADDQILTDLGRLGVSYVTLSGGEASQRISINNTPGLGLGTGTADQFVWPVPNSAIAVTSDQSGSVITGNGVQIAAGDGSRILRLAEPADPRWLVEVGGTRLEAVAGDIPGTQFALGSATGALRYELVSGPNWWAWVELAGLLVLGVMAAPSVRRRTEGEARRVAGGEQ